LRKFPPELSFDPDFPQAFFPGPRPDFSSAISLSPSERFAAPDSRCSAPPPSAPRAPARRGRVPLLPSVTSAELLPAYFLHDLFGREAARLLVNGLVEGRPLFLRVLFSFPLTMTRPRKRAGGRGKMAPPLSGPRPSRFLFLYSSPERSRLPTPSSSKRRRRPHPLSGEDFFFQVFPSFFLVSRPALYDTFQSEDFSRWAVEVEAVSSLFSFAGRFDRRLFFAL